jgi:hypothetical protein
MSRATFSSTPGSGKKFSPLFQRNHDYPKSPLSPHYHENEIKHAINQQLDLLFSGFRISCHDFRKEARMSERAETRLIRIQLANPGLLYLSHNPAFHLGN